MAICTIVPIRSSFISIEYIGRIEIFSIFFLSKKIFQVLHYNSITICDLLQINYSYFLSSRTFYNENGSIHHEVITIINTYALNIRTTKCMKQTFTELKKEIDLQYHQETLQYPSFNNG